MYYNKVLYLIRSIVFAIHEINKLSFSLVISNNFQLTLENYILLLTSIIMSSHFLIIQIYCEFEIVNLMVLSWQGFDIYGTLKLFQRYSQNPLCKYLALFIIFIVKQIIFVFQQFFFNLHKFSIANRMP